MVLEGAWGAIQRNARTSKSQDTKNEVAAFAADHSTNLRRISRQLQQNKFIFPPARGIKIPKDKKDKSKFRPLVVAKVESRIVQRAIHDVLVSVPAIEQFVRTPFSFGGIKKKYDEIAAVPAAVKTVLTSIGEGSKFVIRSDIAKFFTRIQKSVVIDIVAKAVEDSEFIDLFTRAIAVELENMAQLREDANAFPIEDIGVAQGNSLSPLLGNLILYEFDLELNKKPGVRCIRYIDDFIILAPSKEIAEKAFAQAEERLKTLGMSVSAGKTEKARVEDKFEFLGIEFSNGFVRPCKKAQERFINSIKSTLLKSQMAFRASKETGQIENALSLLETLGKVSGIMQGWGKHYRFCNDAKCLENLDQLVGALIKDYLFVYRAAREKTNDAGRWRLLGIEALSQIERKPFVWPKKDAISPSNPINLPSG